MYLFGRKRKTVNRQSVCAKAGDSFQDMSTNAEVRGQLPGEDSLTGESFGPLGRRLSRKKMSGGSTRRGGTERNRKGVRGKNTSVG